MSDPILFSQQLLATVDEGRRVGTHKLLTLLALLDVAPLVDDPEQPEAGVTVPVADLANQVIRITWNHVVPIEGGTGDHGRLSQLQKGGRNEILVAVQQLREAGDDRGLRGTEVVRDRLPREHNRAVSRITTVLVRDPLPRLQPAGEGVEAFLYSPWKPAMTRKRLREQQGRDDPVLQLLPGVAHLLTRLAPLVRPIVEGTLVRDVARWNGLATQEQRLRDVLFGATRQGWPDGLVDRLLKLQRGRCFYEPESGRLRRDDIAIDHVLPWSRTRLDAIPNLVLTRASTNSSKADLLPSRRLLDRWLDGIESRSQIADELGVPAQRDRTRQLALATYGALHTGSPTWDGRDAGARRMRSFTHEDRTWLLAQLRDETLGLAADRVGTYGRGEQ